MKFNINEEKTLSTKMNFLATTIGSLPHNNPELAVDLIYNSFPDVPVTLQLANISQKEDMLSQYNENIPGIIFDKADNRWYMDQEDETFFEKLEEFFLDYESIVNEKNLIFLKNTLFQKNIALYTVFPKKTQGNKA